MDTVYFLAGASRIDIGTHEELLKNNAAYQGYLALANKVKYFNIQRGIMASIDDFKKLELKIAEIKEVNEHPNADRLYVIVLDLGDRTKQV